MDDEPVRRIGTPCEQPAWLESEAWPFAVRQLATPTGNVAVTDAGHGPLLLLVHVGFWSFIWRDVLRALDREHRCVALDAPGTGLSDGIESGDATLEAAGRAVGVVADQLHEPFVLVVHDLGGVAGLRAAARRPDLVRGLVVINSFGWCPSGIPFRLMLALMGSAPVRELDAVTGFLPRASSTRFGVGRNWTRNERAIFRAGVGRSARRSFHRYMRSARDSDALYATVSEALAGELRDKPVLTIFGERNDPLRFQPKWKQRFPHARQVVVPRAYHFPMCDAPELVATTIAAWHRETVSELA